MNQAANYSQIAQAEQDNKIDQKLLLMEEKFNAKLAALENQYKNINSPKELSFTNNIQVFQSEPQQFDDILSQIQNLSQIVDDLQQKNEFRFTDVDHHFENIHQQLQKYITRDEFFQELDKRKVKLNSSRSLFPQPLDKVKSPIIRKNRNFSAVSSNKPPPKDLTEKSNVQITPPSFYLTMISGDTLNSPATSALYPASMNKK